MQPASGPRVRRRGVGPSFASARPVAVRPATWRLERGASIEPDGVRFTVWAPHAERVTACIEAGHEIPLAPGPDGVWSGFAPGVVPGTEYRYRLSSRHGTVERADPVSRFQPRGVHGPSRVVDPAAFVW